MPESSRFVHPNILCCEQLIHQESTGCRAAFAQGGRWLLTSACRIGSAAGVGQAEGIKPPAKDGPVCRPVDLATHTGASAVWTENRFTLFLGCFRRSELLQAKYWPPLAVMVEPVMKPASSDARKTTQRAISSGSPRRPIGICGMMRSLSTFSSIALTISVAI